MKRRLTNLASILVLLALAGTCLREAGCTSGIPLFDSNARLVNRANSGRELYAECNNLLAQLRTDGIITQADIDKNFTPSLKRANEILLSVRAFAHVAATQPSPTTQPIGTVDEAIGILKAVRQTLLTLQRSKA